MLRRRLKKLFNQRAALEHSLLFHQHICQHAEQKEQNHAADHFDHCDGVSPVGNAKCKAHKNKDRYEIRQQSENAKHRIADACGCRALYDSCNT